MRRVLLAAACFAVASSAALAAEWIKLQSANFELYTTSSEREARETLETFEQVRDFFMRIKPSSVTTRLPVTIVGFRNPKEYKPYAPNESAAAYYNGDEQRDCIVMSDLGSEHTHVAIHEYMHLLVRHSGLTMPVWLNEGFAEVYSTLRPLGGQILLGSVPSGHYLQLLHEKWLPLSALVNVQYDSPEYNEKNRIGMFYAESWLLTHMLAIDDGYREKFPDFVLAVSRMNSAETALSQTYGKSISQIDKEMQGYLRTGSLKGILFKTRFQKIQVDPGRPATALEVDLTLAKLTTLLRRYDEAVERYRRLAEAHRDNFEIEEALAHLYWRKGDLNGAREHFGRAVDLGATSWNTYWDYARLLGSVADAGEQRAKALFKTIELRPDLTEARLMLGQEMYRNRKWGQAFVVLREIKNIDSEHASQLFLMLAYAAMNLDRKDDARQYAADAKKHAGDPRQADEADRLLQYLEQAAASPRVEHTESFASTKRIQPPGDNGPPRLQRRPAPASTFSEVAPADPNYLNVKGRLKKFDCLGTLAKMHVSADNKVYVLLIRDATQVRIRSGSGASVTLACGPQDTPITVDYLPKPDAAQKTIGDVYAIELLK